MKTAIHQSLTVGRDSVEPKLDFLGISHGSTESRPTLHRAFTLIELLAVIAIIGIIAAMVVGLSGLAARKKHDAAVTAMKNRLMLFISSYQSKMGFFPPDNVANALLDLRTQFQQYEQSSGLNPLIYELTGATMTTTNGVPAFQAFDGTILKTNQVIAAYGRGGIANSLPDEVRVFFQPFPNPRDYMITNGLKQLVVPVPLTGAPGEINLWHYDCSNPNRHNSSGYDLWAEYSAGKDSQGNPITITNGNWNLP